MKKLIIIGVAVIGFFFIAALIIKPVTASKDEIISVPISDSVIIIAQKSCVSCHTEPGNGMALTAVNLSKWDAYSPEKQVSKAKAMCKMVSKNKMPPRNFRAKHPESILTQEDIKTICDWAKSLKSIEK